MGRLAAARLAILGKAIPSYLDTPPGYGCDVIAKCLLFSAPQIDAEVIGVAPVLIDLIVRDGSARCSRVNASLSTTLDDVALNSLAGSSAGKLERPVAVLKTPACQIAVSCATSHGTGCGHALG